MSVREKRFLESGVMFDQDSVINHSNVILRSIVSLKPLLSTKPREISSARTLAARSGQIQKLLQLASHNDAQLNLLGRADDEEAWVDSLHIGILDACVRLSQKDGRNRLQMDYPFGKEVVRLEAYTTTSSTGEIIILTDYRVVRALIDMFVNDIEARYQCPINKIPDDAKATIHGDYAFDIYDLCRAISIKPQAEGANYVRAMLERLASTEFKITADNAPRFRDKFTKGAHEFRTRIITEFSTYKANESIPQSQLNGMGFDMVDFKNRIYRIKFHSSLLENLLTASMRHRSSPLLRSDKAGIAHRFSSWSQSNIGVSIGPNDKKRSYTIKMLWQSTLTSSLLHNFETSLLNLLARDCIDGPASWKPDQINTSLVHGYFIEYDPCIKKSKELMRLRGAAKGRDRKLYPVITIWRNPADPYIGDESSHNIALKRRAGALEESQLSFDDARNIEWHEATEET